MKFIIVIIVSFTTLLRPILPVMDYAINYDYIQKVLCINKNNPEKKCHGKCHLNENLNKVFDDKDAKSTTSKNSTEELISLICQKHTNKIFIIKNDISTDIKLGNFIDSYTYTFSSVIFHPPCKIV
ncbi:MAG: hypothetical protein IT275_04660 [Chitinophagales bacterium]|nr:hypothetical protein [Chitinophagales bacterium]